MTADPDRTYRAVRLRADEAKYLETQTRPTRDWCPHLDVFHETGDGIDGYKWRRCWVCDKMHDDSDAWDLKIAAERKVRKVRKERERRSDLRATLVVGFLFGLLAGAVLYHWCVWRVS